MENANVRLEGEAVLDLRAARLLGTQEPSTGRATDTRQNRK